MVRKKKNHVCSVINLEFPKLLYLIATLKEIGGHHQ